jgi:hypothetical protein
MGRENGVPNDLTLRYRWCEGSVPPPDHYEYAIEIGHGGGKIEFCPDYPADGVPVWEEAFEISAGELESVYRLLVAKRILRERWTEIEDSPVGGSMEWMEIMARGRYFRVPALVEESSEVGEVYGVIRGLVPEDVWNKMMERYEGYRESGGDSGLQ